MGPDAASGPEPAGDAREESRLGRLFPPSVPARVRRSLVACAGGYAVVGLFAGALAIVDAGWRSLAISTKATIAAIAAAPLALGMLWPRLSGFKAFGFEVSPAQASAREAHEFEGPVVPLVRGLRLDRLVDRLELARQLA